jgi:hypothetical protein
MTREREQYTFVAKVMARWGVKMGIMKTNEYPSIMSSQANQGAVEARVSVLMTALFSWDRGHPCGELGD